jgi:plasmid stabilization system protein ParE
MPRGSKAKYTAKQKTKARLIEQSYERRGVAPKAAAARAWATVNKQTGGGEKSGSGRFMPARKKAAARRDSAKRANATRHGHSPYSARRARPR